MTKEYLKNMMKYIIVLIGLICLNVSCKQDAGNVKKNENPQFFQASDYITKDYREVRKSHKLFKLININETLDSITVADTVGPTEMVLLNKLNLDNAKWSDKYKADTSFGVYGDPDVMNYTALDEELPIQKVSVYLNQGRITNIKVHSQRSSLINHHDQSLIYYPGVGYDLTSTQKMWSGDTIRMNVKATFVKK